MLPGLSPDPPALDSLTDAVDAVARARRELAAWSRRPTTERAALLDSVRRELVRDADAWAEAITRETGKPLTESYGAEVLASLEALKVLVRRGPSWLASRRERRSPIDWLRGVRSRDLVYEPLGVVGIIGTWNYPLLLNLQQIAAALLAGDAVVWKPSERVPENASRLASLLRGAGVPDGVFTVLPGTTEAGMRLAGAGCDKIVFTGSARTGRRVLAVLAENGAPSVMELSGMDAALVCRDADVSRAAQALVWSAMTNNGQACVAAKRLIVHRDVRESFYRAFVHALGKLRLGNPMNPETEIGPLKFSDIRRRVEALVDDAVRKGARRFSPPPVQGKDEDMGRPVFFQPTVLTEVNNNMDIMREEFFGPVAMIQEGSDEDEMVALANDNVYGLAASIWSKDLSRARALAARLEVGSVWINDAVVGAADGRAPFGGVKSSGFGKIHGPEGLREMTRQKWIEACSPGGFRPYYFPYGAAKLRQLRLFLRF